MRLTRRCKKGGHTGRALPERCQRVEPGPVPPVILFAGTSHTRSGSNSQVILFAVAATHLQEYGTPDRHLLCAVRSNNDVSTDGCSDVQQENFRHSSG